MATDSSKVNVAVTGAVSYAPLGSTAPVDADTALTTPWKDVGYISDDGVTENRDRSSNNIVAWQNADVVRTVITESSITLQFAMIEANPNSLELFYGAPVSTTDGSIDIKPSSTGGRRAFVLDYVDGDEFVRLYIPSGEVLEVSEIKHTSGDPVAYEVTVTGYPDPATAGLSAKKWYSALSTGV